MRTAVGLKFSMLKFRTRQLIYISKYTFQYASVSLHSQQLTTISKIASEIFKLTRPWKPDEEEVPCITRCVNPNIQK